VNFADHFDSVADYTGAWPPATFDRLEQVRKTYDAKGLFVYGVPELVG
jgi:hypothetical protein